MVGGDLRFDRINFGSLLGEQNNWSAVTLLAAEEFLFEVFSTVKEVKDGKPEKEEKKKSG